MAKSRTKSGCQTRCTILFDASLRHKLAQLNISSMAVAKIEGRGRALVASQPLTAGEILLRDSPILLYSSLALNPPPPSHHQHQHHLRLLQLLQNLVAFTPPPPPPVPPAPSPSSAAPPAAPPPSPSPTYPGSANPAAAFGPRRRSPKNARSRPASSPPLTTYPPFRLPVSALFSLFKAQKSPPTPPISSTPLSLPTLLRTPNSASPRSSRRRCWPRTSSTPSASWSCFPKTVRDRLGLTLFTLTHCLSINDCLPNACRFDYVDASDAGGFNTNIIVRVIHDVPQGREICLIYFPVNLNYPDRQRRLKEDYGFACACDRCKVEANWVEEEAMDDEVMEVEDVGVGEE